MKKSRFTEEQIVLALKQAELGTPVSASGTYQSGNTKPSGKFTPPRH